MCVCVCVCVCVCMSCVLYVGAYVSIVCLSLHIHNCIQSYDHMIIVVQH